MKSFVVGDRVKIIRHRHGWLDGSVIGYISKIGYRKGGAAFYEVKDADGNEYDIKATKDLVAC